MMASLEAVRLNGGGDSDPGESLIRVEDGNRE